MIIKHKGTNNYLYNKNVFIFFPMQQRRNNYFLVEINLLKYVNNF
jgi:hypothetical protein